MTEPHRQEQSPFASLPAEVLTIITRWVLTDDLLAARRTCKIVETKLASSFSYEFFRKKQFFISTPSLTHVVIATDRFERLFQLGSIGPAHYDDAKRYVAAAEDQEYLFKSGKYREYLVEAFSNLINLDIVDLRDFNSPTRYRDGALSFWTSYGSPTFQRLKEKIFPPHRLHSTATPGDTSLPMTPGGFNSTQSIFAGALVQNLLLALGEAGARPSSLEVTLKDTHWQIEDSTFYIPTSIRPTVLPILENLRQLHLMVSLNDASYAPTELQSPHLKEFITLCPNIDTLRLNFSFNYSFSHSAQKRVQFFTWLADTAAVPASTPATTNSNVGTNGVNTTTDDPILALTLPSPASPPLANLHTLNLGHTTIDATTFVAILKRFPELHTLGLHRMCLEDATDTTATIKDGFKQGTNLWLNLFETLATEPTSVRRLTVSQCAQTSPGVGRCWVSHARLSNPDEKLARKVYDKNKDRRMKSVWDAAAKCVRVTWPTYVDASSHGSDDDSDEDEDDDEEDEDDGEDGDDGTGGDSGGNGDDNDGAGGDASDSNE
ncbi:hypothetical protein Q8F55_006082 [Vanrija albida]|uniref:F-box domain-containing protein n=1 Tax=Vanrija albida TaxID=181172 RepID=A0ABR3Q3E9_9TREE